MPITDLSTTTQRQAAELQPDQATRELLASERVQEVMREIEASLDRFTMQYQDRYRRMTDRAAQAAAEYARASSQQQFGREPAQQQFGRESAQQQFGREPAQQQQYGRGSEQGHMSDQARISAEFARRQERAGMSMGRRSDIEAATPITPLPVPYLWFDLMAVGPYRQPFSGGPLQPARVVHFGEQVVLFAVLWRNPMPLAGGPSAADVMAPLVYQVRGVSVELNSVTPGPQLNPNPEPFGPGFFNIIPMAIPTAPQPAEGRPRPIEIHLTVDILGVGVGLPPFAGFASRWFRPDLQPGFLGQPDILPGIVEESPVRMLIYS
ncbi:hypothetical protein [Nonomuraea insulae]|uniref:Uncharacterized protein n=1 Tax=Nonomuraea insulae TaxID=1616787 RepID=A0ABW1DDA3_9ACTN